MIRNAQIDSTFLGYEAHGILTIDITVDYGDGGMQSFGGYSLGGRTGDSGYYLHAWVSGVLKALGEDKWENLKGLHVRVDVEEGWNGKITQIGHFMKDNWFNPADIKIKENE